METIEKVFNIDKKVQDSFCNIPKVRKVPEFANINKLDLDTFHFYGA